MKYTFEELKKAHYEGKRIQVWYPHKDCWQIIASKPTWGHRSGAKGYRIHPDDVSKFKEGDRVKLLDLTDFKNGDDPTRCGYISELEYFVGQEGIVDSISDSGNIYIKGWHYTWPPQCFMKVEVDAEGWIDWSGGKCPLSANVDVDYIMRHNQDIGNGIIKNSHSNNLRWSHKGVGGDIVKYRVVSCKGTETESTYLTQPKEVKVMKSIKIETQTNIIVDGVPRNANSLGDEIIFNHIADMEKEIDKLKEIKNKPKKLTAEIERMEGEIKALVAYVDGRKDTSDKCCAS